MAPAAIAAVCAREVSVRRYTDTSPEMHQPPLSENMLCVHLGGAKEVRRWHSGRHDVHTVELGALTTMPAGQANRWLTHGPVDFAHITLPSALMGQTALEEFDRDAASLHLIDHVGFRDPFLESLFSALLATIERRGSESGLYADSLLTVLTHRLLSQYSTLDHSAVSSASRALQRRGGLAPWRLQRVTDYMQAHLDADIRLADLTDLAGFSRAQFFRAFKQSTGVSPYRYLMLLRLDRAKALLGRPDADVAAVGHAVGMPTTGRLILAFRQHFGLTPKAYIATLRSHIGCA